MIIIVMINSLFKVGVPYSSRLTNASHFDTISLLELMIKFMIRVEIKLIQRKSLNWLLTRSSSYKEKADE